MPFSSIYEKQTKLDSNIVRNGRSQIWLLFFIMRKLQYGSEQQGMSQGNYMVRNKTQPTTVQNSRNPSRHVISAISRNNTKIESYISSMFIAVVSISML